MAFLIVVIFLLVLVFTILPHILPGISRKLVELTVEECDEEHKLRKQIRELKTELQTIHMVDQFAKYAKTERKIIKLKIDLEKICKTKTEVFLKFKLGINTVFHVLQLVCFLYVIYTYRQETLTQMPADWLTPVNKIISFPTGKPGVVSTTFWVVVCRSSIPRLMKMFMNQSK